MNIRWFVFLITTLALPTAQAQTRRPPNPRRAPQPFTVHVTLAQGMPSPISGRLLIFLTSKKADANELKPDETDPRAVWIEAEEVHDLLPGKTVDVPPDVMAYPDGFSHLPSGDYVAMALLDVNH